MRASLDTLLSQTVTLEYTLPNASSSMPKVIVSTDSDECYRILTNGADLAMTIYNGIVDYSFEESAIDLTKLDTFQTRALISRLKFDRTADVKHQLNYGLYGEVLLFLMLQKFHNASTVLSRGHMYNPLNSSETTGYDTYQMILAPDNSVELWFGEVKFRKDFRTGVQDILKKITFSLSDDYFRNNVIAMENFESFMNKDSNIHPLLEAFRENPNINLAQLANKNGVSFVYPMLVVFDDESKSYDDIIKDVVNYTNQRFSSLAINFSMKYKMFFMLLPVKVAKDIKEQVRVWIMSNQPLI